MFGLFRPASDASVIAQRFIARNRREEEGSPVGSAEIRENFSRPYGTI